MTRFRESLLSLAVPASIACSMSSQVWASSCWNCLRHARNSMDASRYEHPIPSSLISHVRSPTVVQAPRFAISRIARWYLFVSWTVLTRLSRFRQARVVHHGVRLAFLDGVRFDLVQVSRPFLRPSAQVT